MSVVRELRPDQEKELVAERSLRAAYNALRRPFDEEDVRRAAASTDPGRPLSEVMPRILALDGLLATEVVRRISEMATGQ